jgi:hypothetical protein
MVFKCANFRNSSAARKAHVWAFLKMDKIVAMACYLKPAPPGAAILPSCGDQLKTAGNIIA